MRARDHPRSRGVYGERSSVATDRVGSSPLARGLQYVADINDDLARIIPARAGFTRPGAPGSPGSPDHPRSRGVYPSSESSAEESAGSSPLARGLHEQLRVHYESVRIIPARAGFTECD